MMANEAEQFANDFTSSAGETSFRERRYQFATNRCSKSRRGNSTRQTEVGEQFALIDAHVDIFVRRLISDAIRAVCQGTAASACTLYSNDSEQERVMKGSAR